jgi:hypothetical protein
MEFDRLGFQGGLSTSLIYSKEFIAMASLKCTVFTVGLSCLWILGCDSTNQGNPFSDTTDNLGAVEEEGSGEGESNCEGEGECGGADYPVAEDPGSTFVGTWGEILNLPVKQLGIYFVNQVIAVGRTYYLNKITSDGKGNLTIEHKACRIVIKINSDFGKMAVPQKFVDGLEPLVRRVSLSSNQPGTPFVSDNVYEVRGAKLLDLENDPLPPHASGGEAIACDEAPMGSQCDQDNDGFPGMTNILGGSLGCKVYVAQKWHALYEGTIIDADNIAGRVTQNNSWQVVLDSNLDVCKEKEVTNMSVMKNCPEYYYFKMVRLPENATCEDVMALTSCDEEPNKCDKDSSYSLNPKNEDLSLCDPETKKK